MKVVYTVSILLVAMLSATATAQDSVAVDTSAVVVETGNEAAPDANFEYDTASIGATAVEEVGADADVATAADETTEVAEADREAAEEVRAEADAATADAVTEVGADADVAVVDEATDVAEADREAVDTDAVEDVGADADGTSVEEVAESDEVGADADATATDDAVAPDATEADREATDTDAVEEVGADADAAPVEEVDETAEVGADADAADGVEETDVTEADREATEGDADADEYDIVGADDANADDVTEVGADADAAPVAEVGAEAEPTMPLIRQSLIMTINKRRQEAGIPQICLSNKLMTTAQAQSSFMAKTNTISVTGDQGSSPSSRGTQAGFNATAGVAEVVGAGYDKAEDLINAWMQDQSSKDIVLGNYTHMGPGYTMDAKQQYVKYWTVDFSYGVSEACSGLSA